jgi:hypothetical protein
VTLVQTDDTRGERIGRSTRLSIVVRIWVGIGVMVLVSVVIGAKLHGYARRHGYRSYWQLNRNIGGAGGLLALGVGLPIMGEIGGLIFLLPGAVAVWLCLWWYGDR